MKKYYKWITAFLLVVSVFWGMTSCQQEVKVPRDKTAPANVTKLTVTAADGNAVLTWKNPTDADFDGVQVSMNPAEGTLLNPVILGKNVTSLNVGGLTIGKEYTFTVKTIDTSNNKSSGVSAKAEVADTSDIIAPAEVTELTVQAANGNAVLNWKNPTDADFDGVQISMNPPEGTLINPFSLGKDVTSFDVSGLENGKEYTFTVKSFDTSLNYSEGTSVNAIVELKTIITSVTIPVAGISYAGNLLQVTINGKNFKAPGATASGFTSTGATLTNVTIITDTYATAKVTCPDVVGTTNVTVSYGDSSATTTLKVIEPVDSSYEVGDIILIDGTKVSVNDIGSYTRDKNNKPIGVVAMISDAYGVPTPKVIGLRDESGLKWAPSGTTGYNRSFTNIICTPSSTGEGAASYSSFTGDTDGSDNWAEICAVDPEGTQDAAKNYPIFNFANTYGTTAGLTGTDYENGWYVPSIAELCEVYRNMKKINTSLGAAGSTDLVGYIYWSSSQYYYSSTHPYNEKAYFVDFFDGCLSWTGKNEYYNYYNSYFVCVLHTVIAK